MLKDLPVELNSIIYKFVGEHPVAKLIKHTFKHKVEGKYNSNKRMLYTNTVINALSVYHRRQIKDHFECFENRSIAEVGSWHWDLHFTNKILGWKYHLENIDGKTNN